MAVFTGKAMSGDVIEAAGHWRKRCLLDSLSVFKSGLIAAAKVCGTRKPQVRHLQTHGGNHCGYGYYIYACLKTD
ncbi:hypothetical protein [Rhizobium phaseoli]|uniref:hypothetical protein n=1 Tax=Rhizobium phaseoli TaxID=396 RepID=UPI0012373A8C|nr:hypothetical protein [Rhizobium phaseoli]